MVMPEAGDLLFIRPDWTSIVDDAIVVGEEILYKRKQNYVHVCVYVGNNQVSEAQGLRKSGIANFGDYAGLYQIGRINMTYDQRQQFLSALQAENGMSYDWVGIFWLIVKIFTGYDKKYRERRTRYCTKYVGWALAKAGIVVNDETPDSLAMDPHVVMERG